jgi:hypothetical protein
VRELRGLLILLRWRIKAKYHWQPIRDSLKSSSVLFKWGFPFGTGIGLAKWDEYGVALICFGISAFFLLIRALLRPGFPNHRKTTYALRIVGVFVSISFFFICWIVTLTKKDEKSWSPVWNQYFSIPTAPLGNIAYHFVPGSAYLKTAPVTPPHNPRTGNVNQRLKPSSVEVLTVTGDDDADHAHFIGLKPNFWFDQERSCTPSLKCYSEMDLKSQAVRLSPGSKGWTRIFFVIYDTSESAILSPYVAISLASGHGVSINLANDHHSLGPNNSTQLEFKRPQIIDKLLPFAINHSGYEFITDLVVDGTVEKFVLIVTVYGDNLEVAEVVVPVTIE